MSDALKKLAEKLSGGAVGGAAAGKREVEMTVKNVDILREGAQIILPPGMGFPEAIEWLKRKMEEDEKKVAVLEVVKVYPFDGAYALMKALSHKFGWVDMRPTPGFFGPQPPAMIGVSVSPTETVQVPWGRIAIPGVEGWIQTQVEFTEEGNVYFKLVGEVKQKHKGTFAEIAALTRQFVREQSIYRGKAVKVNFPDYNEKEFSMQSGPKFLDVSSVKEEQLIFPADTAKLVESCIFTPILYSQYCRDQNIPLKRGALLEGPYGVGKTLTAYVTAKKCVESGWTFIYLENVEELDQAIQFAKQYSPAVIFAEDIDQVTSGGRSEEMNDILNTLDGIDTKESEVMVILTTNHVDNINPALLRPGRLDAVISVRPPDAAAVRRLIKQYAGNLLAEGEKLDLVSKQLEGQIPAFIREVVERSKLEAIARVKGSGHFQLIEQDLVNASVGMLQHISLVTRPSPENKSDVEKAAEILAKSLESSPKDSNGKVAGSALPLFASPPAMPQDE